MAGTNNSISTLLNQLLKLYNSSVENFEKINEAVVSNKESVTLNIEDTEGNISRVTIPSFGYIVNKLTRLEDNLKTLTNASGSSNSSVRLPDGSFRKLLLGSLPTEGNTIDNINNVESFNVKSNWFFEELMNPLMYVTFNLTGQVPANTESAIVKRFILNLNTKSKINFFENEYQGKFDINHSDFIRNLVERNIDYVIDESTIDLPPKEKKLIGKFDVLRISDISTEEIINGQPTDVISTAFKLNKITYTDVDAEFPDTLQLKVGDYLDVNDVVVDTRYQITRIDNSTNSVFLRLIEGFKPISIGVDSLKLGTTINEQVFIDVNIGFDERCVVFIKPIDPSSRIPAVDWSPGSAFYTNALNTIDLLGNQQSLKDFYQENVIDFGRFLLSFAQDKYPTVREGLIPNKPVIADSDFKVRLINQQLVNSKVVVELNDLNNQKLAIESRLNELSQAISQKRSRIQTTNYNSNVERDADRNELQGLIDDRESQAKLYSSLVKEISGKAQDSSAEKIEPKYRIRGFFKIPEERISAATGPQKIIQFKTRYRYLSSDGAANPVEQFNFNSGDSVSRGAFANWTIVESIIRNRVKNKVTNKYEWESINDENADAININQVDIPIQKGELVEVQIKSVSEAGWPQNPIESDWSDSVIVEFPADLSSENAVRSIISQNREDLAKVALNEDLNAKDIDEHLSSAFRDNTRYFSHSAASIFSGFLSENQTPIDLFSKLNEFQNKILEFTEILNRSRGELKVSLIDDRGDIITLNKDTLTRVFAGFYSVEVNDLDDPRGAIISKTFFINLSNSKQSILELVSRIGGNRNRMVNQSELPVFDLQESINGNIILPATYNWLDNHQNNQFSLRPTYISSDSDYNVTRKYDLAPIILTNPEIDVADTTGQIKSIVPYQSTQTKNQFIYSRFTDVSAETPFYSYINPDGQYIINLDKAENYYTRAQNTGSRNNNQFIWGGGFNQDGQPTTAATYDGNNDSTIEIHISHPLVSNYQAYKSAYESLTGDLITLPSTLSSNGIDCTATGNGTAAILFRQSKFAPLKQDNKLGKLQSIYINEDPAKINALSNNPNYPNTVNKMVTPSSDLQDFKASDTLEKISVLSDPDDANYVGFARNAKHSFDIFDQYLLGKKSVGSYLFISTTDHPNIQVNGDAVTSIKQIEFGSSNSINIPIVFQYRMTDYFGPGDGEAGGIGNIGGDSSGATTNLTYAKRIGIDIHLTKDIVHQFDIEFFAKYRSDSLNIDRFPSATVARGIGGIEETINKLSPNISETRFNN